MISLIIYVPASIADALIFFKNIFLIKDNFKPFYCFEFKFYHQFQNMFLLETDSIYFIK